MAYIPINGCVNRIGFAIGNSPDSDAEMGRPPLGMKPTTVRLTAETLRRIAALVGNRRIASFIREAVENELQRRGSESTADE